MSVPRLHRLPCSLIICFPKSICVSIPPSTANLFQIRKGDRKTNPVKKRKRKPEMGNLASRPGAGVEETESSAGPGYRYPPKVSSSPRLSGIRSPLSSLVPGILVGSFLSQILSCSRWGCYFFEFRYPPNLILEGCRRLFKKKNVNFEQKKIPPKKNYFSCFSTTDQKKIFFCLLTR